MTDKTKNLINELLKLSEWERKQIAMALIASTLGPIARNEVIELVSA